MEKYPSKKSTCLQCNHYVGKSKESIGKVYCEIWKMAPEQPWITAVDCAFFEWKP